MLSNFSTNLHTYYFIRSGRVYGRGGGVGIMIHMIHHVRLSFNKFRFRYYIWYTN